MIYFVKFIKFQDTWFKVHKKRKFKPELKILTTCQIWLSTYPFNFLEISFGN